MTNPLIEHARHLIAERRDQLAGTRADIAQQNSQIEDLEQAMAKTREALATLLEAETLLADELAELESTLAILQERLTPKPVPAPAKPKMPLSPERERIRRDLHDATTHMPEPILAGRPAQAPAGRSSKGHRPGDGTKHLSRDPLRVLERNSTTGHRSPKAAGHKPLHLRQPEEIEFTRPITKTDTERAELVFEILREANKATNAMLGNELADLLDCKVPTAQRIVSDSLAILYQARRVRPTGEHCDRSAEWTTED